MHMSVNDMDTNSLVLSSKYHLKCSRPYCMDMGMVRSNSLDSSCLHSAVVDVVDVVVDDDDNSMDRMGRAMAMAMVLVMDMDTGDRDRLVVERLAVFSSLALDDRRTMDEIHEFVAAVVRLFHFVWAQHCSA